MTSTQHVYERHGGVHIRTPASVDDAPAQQRVPTIADSVPVRWIMSRDVICARENLDVDTLVELIVDRQIGCVPVVDREGFPIGVVTKRDLTEQLLLVRRQPQVPALEVHRLMMPLAFTLDEHATIAHAAAMMCAEGIHHVLVVSAQGVLVGVVSSHDIVRWLARNDGLFLA